MEIIFDYETMKHTLVLTAYVMLLFFDFFWIGYLISSFTAWVIKKIKHLASKKKKAEEMKEENTHE